MLAGGSAVKRENPLAGQVMMDDLQQIVAQLEDSLRVIEEQGGDEIMRKPELLEKMYDVAQSLVDVTRSLQEIEQSPAMNDKTTIPPDQKPEL